MEASGKESCKNVDKNELKNEIKEELKTELKNEFKIGTKSEVIMGHRPIPLKIANKVMKSICKITIDSKKGIAYGTGFFLNYSDEMKYLMTCFHVINPSLEKENIEIEIYNEKTMKLNFKNRFTKYIPKPKDIAIIEIKKSDEIYKDIEFLDYDYNYIKKGYAIYNNVDIFTVEHPYGDDASCASGKIIKINDNEFEHNIPTDNGSSGCPIILLNNNINLIQAIGIHKEGDNIKKINGGTFIGGFLNEDSNEHKNNYIIAEIFIKEEDINKNIRIINSYEECLRNKVERLYKDDKYKNENEIKKCEIKINEKLIKFNYFHKFQSKGKYIMKYIFKNDIKNICLMFRGCSSLTNIDLSNFNTNNVTIMNGIFGECSSLTNIDLSNCNTKNVNDMGCMFSGCSSLTNIDLSNFNTDNVINMNGMFYECSSLTNIDLSNFNTDKVNNMEFMFNGCSSLVNIDLSNFNTDNVTNMNGMFDGCSSLTNNDLSNFNKRKKSDQQDDNLINFNKIKSPIESKDDFIIENIKRIKELYEGESYLEKILNSNIEKNEYFVVFDKQWLDTWKRIVDYDILKERLRNFKDSCGNEILIDEVRNIFLKLNTKQKLEELGEMDTTKLMKYSICNKLINEKSDFIPILSNYSVYFSRIIKNSLTISGQISNKKIFIDNIYINKKLLNLKNIERKLIILYKEYGKKEYNRIIINIEIKENIKKIINELKNKKIEDIINLKKYKIDIITSEIIQTERRKKEEEEEKKRKEEEEEKKRKEEERRKEEN